MLLHGDCTGATIIWPEKDEVLYDACVYDGMTKVIMDDMTRQMLMIYTHDTVEYLLNKADKENVSFTIKLYLYHSPRREVCIKYDPVEKLITTVFEPITYNHNYKLDRFDHLDDHAATLKERLSMIYHEHEQVTIHPYEPFRRVSNHRLPFITSAPDGIPYISVSLHRVQSSAEFERYIRLLLVDCFAMEFMVPGKENEIIYSDSYSTVWSQKMKN
jgi:hypothetical protein